MRIIWTSKYRTFSLHFSLGIAIFLCSVLIATSVGFFGGSVYQKTSSVKNQLTPITSSQNNFTKKAKTISPIVTTNKNNIEEYGNKLESALSTKDANLKINALSKILAELQAKLTTIETLHNEVNPQEPVVEKSKSKKTVKAHKSSLNNGMGGRFESLLDKKDKLPVLDYLLNGSMQALGSAFDLEAKMLRNQFQSLQNKNENLFIPSVVPVNSRVSSKYGARVDPLNFTYAMHRGIDFAAVTGTPIYAVAAGVVENVKHAGAYGRHVFIRHNKKLVSLYAHTSKIIVKPGAFIQKGQLIAYIGSSGRVSGPHLHLEIRVNGQAVNPERYINLHSKTASTK